MGETEGVTRELKELLIRSIFRFKKVGMSFPCGLDTQMSDLRVSMGELVCLKAIADNTAESTTNTCATDIQQFMYVSKPAISQMLNALDKKGFVIRETNKNNRREQIITLTPEGKGVLDLAENAADRMLTEIVTRFGEKDTKQLVELFDRFADITEELKDTAFS
jgi:DNA-binding MarR family transcriptional regulator